VAVHVASKPVQTSGGRSATYAGYGANGVAGRKALTQHTRGAKGWQPARWRSRCRSTKKQKAKRQQRCRQALCNAQAPLVRRFQRESLALRTNHEPRSRHAQRRKNALSVQQQ